jgi:hypothetical protein
MHYVEYYVDVQAGDAQLQQCLVCLVHSLKASL